CLDRAGFAGADGATHHGAYDIAYMRCLPNMIVSSPMNESELRNLMYTAQEADNGPFTIRYPRGEGVITEWKTPMKKVAIGTGRKLSNGSDVAILSLGHIGNLATEAITKLEADGIEVSHYDMRFVKPIDEMLLHEVFGKFTKIVTIEDGSLMGGIGSAILEFMSENNYSAQVKRLGIPDRVIEHGSQQELYKECSYDVDGIYETVKEVVGKKLSKEEKTQIG
ncbi:MAG: 1-deoxy-D-xylulose-5-phosphate synthase, partial [Flavobacteriales bacterium]|nr:1-deoxy-D-xylulose-5-phosphate synthase [Flavobacteriales bacterium]